MGTSEVSGLISRIDESIANSDERIQAEVSAYIEAHPDEVAKQLSEFRQAIIPTFAGDFVLTLGQLEEIASQPDPLEEVAS